MRILILTHPRSGGMSILSWLANEMKVRIIHEPELNDSKLKEDVLNTDDISVKIFPNKVIEFGFNLIEFINKFDKVICHKRTNKRDVAISALKTEKDYIKTNKNEWHKPYTLTDECLKENENENEINEYVDIVKEFENILENTPQDNFLHTTYESIFYDKTSIKPLCKFLEIKNPKWLDILDSSRRLQNGDIGMDNFKQSKELPDNII